MFFQKNTLSLQKKSCTRQFENKFSLRSFALSLQKISCTRQFESKLSLRSLALSFQKISGISAKHSSKLDVLHSICIIFAEN